MSVARRYWSVLVEIEVPSRYPEHTVCPRRLKICKQHVVTRPGCLMNPPYHTGYRFWQRDAINSSRNYLFLVRTQTVPETKSTYRSVCPGIHPGDLRSTINSGYCTYCCIRFHKVRSPPSLRQLLPYQVRSSLASGESTYYRRVSASPKFGCR